MFAKKAVLVVAVSFVVSCVVSLCWASTNYMSSGKCQDFVTPDWEIRTCVVNGWDGGIGFSCGGSCRTITGDIGSYCDQSTADPCAAMPGWALWHVEGYECKLSLDRKACQCNYDDGDTYDRNVVIKDCN